ncbi:MAG TPA: YXWGXW repeat-containing protein [Terracidiphilus sp.]|nr:YXWGXW repeat-containing protein [Terracidiphilus sp.]
MRRILRISLLGVLGLMLLTPAFAQVVISVGFAPPALPVYEQPPCPTDGWMWIPGFWAWDADFGDYYWVPGTWVPAPQPGYLWTPPWWGWENGAFIFHDGYWGPEIGFYGGVNYGFGYFGRGFYGGRWDHDRFYYNKAVVHVNETVIRNVYVDQNVINNTTIVNNHVSYNGGEGGIGLRPTPEEERAAQGRHLAATQVQMQRRETARANPQSRASANQGRPQVAATARADAFSGRDVVAAKSAGAPYHPPANREATPRATPEPVNPNENLNASHARDLKPHEAGPPPNTGDPRLDQKYQQQQQKLIDKQNQEHQKLQAQQEKEDQQLQRRQAAPQQQQQMEQRHAQQTQQMVQRHTQETQQLRQQQAPRPQKPPR